MIRECLFNIITTPQNTDKAIAKKIISTPPHEPLQLRSENTKRMVSEYHHSIAREMLNFIA